MLTKESLKSTPPPTLPVPPQQPVLHLPGQQQPKKVKDTLYLHWQQCHPNANGIPRNSQRKQTIYDTICKNAIEGALDITKLVIAYSKPPNLKEVLTKAEYEGATISYICHFNHTTLASWYGIITH